MSICWYIWGYAGTYRYIRVYLHYMVIHGYILVYMGIYGYILLNMGILSKYGYIWVNMIILGRFEYIWVYMGINGYIYNGIQRYI